MRKKKLKVLVLILCVISQIFLIFAISKIEHPFLRNDTWEKSTKTKTELPQLSFTLTWAPNGTIISTASNDQWYPQICSDGAGGAIITWQDLRNPLDYDIYAQRIDSSGNVQWTADGVAICTAINTQYKPQICSDGAGGAIITWEDYRSGNLDIYAQRINSSGNVQWTADGVAICTASNIQYKPQICSDGARGAIITWEDHRSGSNYDIYAQRIDSSGNVQWTADGVAICTAINTQYRPQICSDGAGGAIITWEDPRSGLGYDIYAQRINSSGNVQWTADGVAICTASNKQCIPQICSDGAGGAIITWQDYRSYSAFHIYAQRIDSSGNVQWTADGVAICTAINTQVRPQICSDGAGGAIITWDDYRSGLDSDIYAQRIDSSGNVEWTIDGVAICTATYYQSYHEICSDGAGGAIITWHDYRSGLDYDIYAQRISVPPEITIISPSQNQFFGSETPNFDISIVEPNLNTTWYTLDDGMINKTFTGLTGTIDQTEWDKKGHGTVTIWFYANDTFGKEGQAEVIVNKDLNAPNSIISFIPHSGTNIVNRSTMFSLSANDGLESGVLNIRYKVNNSAWTDYTGPFTLSALPTGDYIISYYAIDAVGNMEVENTLLVKLVEITVQEPLPDMTIIILTASIIGGIGVVIAITIILIRKRK